MNEEGVRFHLNGNVLVYNGTEAGYYSDTIDQDEEDQAYFQEKQKGQQEIYEALHTKLITSYSKLTEEEKSRDVFENLVDVSQIAADIPAGTEQEFVSEDGTLYGIIANNEGMGPLRLEESNVQQGERRLCFVIATGNVVLDSCRYRGLLLAGGAVTAQGEVTLERDEDSFLKVMKAKGQTMPEENRKGMFEYLAGGELYMTGNIASHTPDIEEYFHLTDLIVCENWEKW